MFSVIQLSFLILSDYDYINPLQIGALDRKEVNGLNIDNNAVGSSKLSSRVILNGFTTENYLANINFMFYLTFILSLIGIAFYSISYTIINFTSEEIPMTTSL